MVYKRKSPAKRSYNRKRRAVRKVSAPVKKFVKQKLNMLSRRVIHRYSENKTPAVVTALDTQLVSMGSATWGTLINLASIFQISQGTGAGNRIGNSLKPIKWSWRGFIHNTGNTQIPVVVKMFIFKSTQGYQSPDTISANPTDFFQNGSGSIAPAATYTDLIRDINKDRYTLYTTRTFKCAPASVSSSLATNNDFKSVNMFKINLLINLLWFTNLYI